MIDLKGKTFKRNRYGLSSWTDTIQDVWIQWHLIDRNTRAPNVMVKGTIHTFPISEIVIIGEPNHFVENLMLDKQEIQGELAAGRMPDPDKYKIVKPLS